VARTGGWGRGESAKASSCAGNLCCSMEESPGRGGEAGYEPSWRPAPVGGLYASAITERGVVDGLLPRVKKRLAKWGDWDGGCADGTGPAISAGQL